MTDQFDTVEEALEDIKAGKSIILVDDEDRENEGDLVMAAEKVTAEDINFMAKYGRGLICLALTPERVTGNWLIQYGAVRPSYTVASSVRPSQNGPPGT